MSWRRNYTALVLLASILYFAIYTRSVSASEPLSITLEGVEGGPFEHNIRVLLTLSQESDSSRPERIELAESRALDEIRQALKPFGYYHPTIEGGVSRHDGHWKAVYRIDLGPPLILSEVEVRVEGEAETLPDMRAVVETFPLKVGDILDQSHYEQGKRALQDQATELGFFDAYLSRHEIKVDLDSYQARIYLHLNSGNRYLFGKVSFGPTDLETDLLQRFVRFKPEEPYRGAYVLALQKSLLNSGYFLKADVVPKPTRGEPPHVPVEVELGMAPRNRYDLGGGYGTDTGPRMSFAYRNRFINQYGHHFQANARLSFVWNELNAVYAIPLADPEKDQLAFTAKSGLENTEAGRADVLQAGIQHTTTRWGLRESMSLDFHRERFTLEGDHTTCLLIPSIQYGSLKSDDDIYPQQGFRINTQLAGAWRGMISDVSFARLRVFAKGLYSLNNENRLIARAQWGGILTDDFDQLPITQRFYAGGDQSVRGYRLNEISPENAEGTRIGGRHLLTASFEYDRALFDAWGIALFSDAGYVYNEFGEPLRIGVGAGARWRSPVGPVRLDVAVPLSKAEDAFQIHLVLGPDL